MTASLLAIALLGLPPPSLDLTLDVSPGQTISGFRDFRVRVERARGLVTQVEFYVGGELRDSVTSIPYIFKLDTLNEDDGDLTLMFAAYTSEGETGKKTVAVRVDNGLAQGPEFHAKRANEFLTDSKWDDALLAARVALRAKPGYNPARVAMARAYFGKRQFDKAQKFAEDALASDPKNASITLLLSAINVERAFSATSRTGQDRKATLDNIRQALKSAIDLKQKILDAKFDTLGKPTPENVIPYTDAAIQAGRYTLAHSAVSTAFHQDNRRADLANRLAYSQIRLSRYSDAYTTLRTLKRFGKYDAYSYALEAVTELCLGAEKEASDSIKEAILNNGDDLGVLTAQAYAALRRNDTAVLSRLVASLMQDHAQRTEVNTYLSALLNRTGRLEEARRYFIDAVKADPLNIDIYIQEANQSIQIGLTGKLAQADAMHELDTAETMFDAALTAHPESAEALTGMSIVRLFRLDYAGAAKLAKAANEASPSYGAALYVLACAHQNLRQSLIAQADMVAAGEIDGTHLRGHSPPSPQLAWRYFSTYGRTPLLTPPG